MAYRLGSKNIPGASAVIRAPLPRVEQMAQELAWNVGQATIKGYDSGLAWAGAERLVRSYVRRGASVVCTWRGNT